MADAASPPLLEARDLRCERDGRLLFEALGFTLRRGEVLQIGGPNGCGKTTLLRSLASLSQRVSGEVYWCGKPVAGNRYDYLRASLFLGHDAGVSPMLTPVEDLHWHRTLWGQARGLGVEEALGHFGLSAHLHTPVQKLSAGQKRRVALARLLLSPATLWILDEPFTAIDLGGVAELESLLADHAASGGAVLLTTHHRLATIPGLRCLMLGEQGRTA